MLDQINWALACWLLIVVGSEFIHLAVTKPIGYLAPSSWLMNLVQVLLDVLSNGEARKLSPSLRLIDVDSDGPSPHNHSWILNQIFVNFSNHATSMMPMTVGVFKLPKGARKTTDRQIYAAHFINSFQFSTLMWTYWHGDPSLAFFDGLALLTTAFVWLIWNSPHSQQSPRARRTNRKAHGTFILTAGHRSRHAMVIISEEGSGIDIEKHATSTHSLGFSFWTLVAFFRLVCSALLTINMLQLPATGPIVAASLLGVVYNVWLAFQPGGYGIDMEFVRTVIATDGKVSTLVDRLEDAVRGAGGMLLLFMGSARHRDADSDSLGDWMV
ncbi:uncharacterized protein AB675_5165 [Cyphellophora attinorum]|uniref:Uncharacterized protein n=1 Tax=Cyphellophora attinorum TaxID=1664694 RepID=A0A0N1HSS7_9EURO|nr:uncharacterized protein AB675_5165 [Phialophora attinorum]KPI39360.1 hypothetical protein AB675_5165 [Phialophora attinorum]